MTKREGHESRREPQLEPLADWATEGGQQLAEVLDSVDPTSVALILTLWKATHVQTLASHRAMDSIGLPVSLSGTRLAVLGTLYLAPDRRMSLSAIAKTTKTHPTIISNIVDALKRGGLVERAGSKLDRRVSLAQLTPEGEEAVLKLLPILSAHVTEVCSHYTEQEKKRLLLLLQRLL